jgi:hypothetical protein
MASVKQGQITKPPSLSAWWKHMRRRGKRQFWKRERKAGKALAQIADPTP